MALAWLMNLGFGGGGVATTAAGYYDEPKGKRRRKVVIDGLTYFVTQAEEAEIVQRLIQSLEQKIEAKPEPKPEPRKTQAKKPQRAIKPDNTNAVLLERLYGLRLYQALLTEEMQREADHLANLEYQQRLINQQNEDDAIALILAVAN